MKSEKIKSLVVVAVFAYCISLYPAVLRYTVENGHDAIIYWEAGRGNTEWIQINPQGVPATGWVYSDRLLPGLRIFSRLDYPYFLAILHTLNSFGVAALMAAILRSTDRYPVLGWGGVFILGAKASDIVSGGNVTGMLCGMSLTPLGALLASAVKPHYMLAFVFHAAFWSFARRRDVAVCDHA